MYFCPTHNLAKPALIRIFSDSQCIDLSNRVVVRTLAAFEVVGAISAFAGAFMGIAKNGAGISRRIDCTKACPALCQQLRSVFIAPFTTLAGLAVSVSVARDAVVERAHPLFLVFGTYVRRCVLVATAARVARKVVVGVASCARRVVSAVE